MDAKVCLANDHNDITYSGIKNFINEFECNKTKLYHPPSKGAVEKILGNFADGIALKTGLQINNII
jgi:hypothetical protein